MTEQPDPPAGRPLAIDGRAESADPALPAFLARPAGAPVYHGFPVIDGFESDSFRLGMITGFLSEPTVAGDAYVIARMGVVPGWSGSPAALPISGRSWRLSRTGGECGQWVCRCR